MKNPFKIILLFFFLMNSVAAQVLRPFAPRYSNTSVRGNIVYVANNSITTNGRITTENPPGGTTVNNGGTAAYVDIDNPVPAIKIPFGSIWNYHANNAAPPNDGSANNWKLAPYTLTGPWNIGGVGTGAAKYGYRTTPATCLPSGQVPICTPAAGNKYISYYFRRNVSFTALELSTTFQSIQLDLVRDDGIVVYVNGVERIRDNMPGGAIVYGTLASANIAVGATENVSYNLSTAFFNAGVNTIAVEVHLNSATRADMSFDMQVSGLDNNGTFNSSSADLNLASCSKVLFAGLYWGASQGTDGTNVGWRTGETGIKLKLPGAGTYTTLTSTQSDYHDGTLVPGLPHTGYRCFADITSLVNTANPNGTYTIGNVVGPLGIVNGSGGWTIVVVFSNPVLQPRNLTVFDGSAIMNGGDPPLYVGVNGFLTPPSGPVSCELGAVVYDGDRVSQDEFSFKQNSNPLGGTFTSQTPNATANLNDMWNSTISYKGATVLTRNPAQLNTLGFDADIIDVPNVGNAVLGNSQTSACIRFSSPSENYFLHCVTTSISIYNPSFAFDKTSTDINGGTVAPGDSLRYQVNYNNVGNDVSTNSIIIDNIPAGSTYLRGSLKINGVSKTDVSTDDQAEYDLINNRVVFRLGTGANAVAGGNIPVGTSGNLQFDVIIGSSCRILNCLGDSITNIARMNYVGLTSNASLHDSSGVNASGCITQGPVTNFTTGLCSTPSDTLLVNTCPVTSVTIPWRRFAGYNIYSAMPFIAANLYDPVIPVTSSHVYWAYFTNAAGCDDTIRLRVFIIACPDIDDDNDGIPDFVELNNPLALQDANSNGIPNWNDAAYAGFTDNNVDGFNDNFDPSADSDNDGILNFYDNNFPGYVDSNGDGINDTMDKDLDGIPNHLDLDSDNDGIPDTVESYGVDQNGDGVIDNYSTSDFDGFSQNVDASSGGVPGSGNGLGAPDFDNDGIANYLDTDSDNDGIPDVIEVFGNDADNDGYVDTFTDFDADGLSDNVDSDLGNDGIAENTTFSLLRTGADTNGDGRADSYPFKNMDYDGRPNPYDLDSDMDGIVDVIEAGFLDADYNGFADGPVDVSGWNISLNAQPTLGVRNSDGRAGPDFLDIDADDDGIPDNVEGMTTLGYQFPAYLDTDNDGLDNRYDNIVGVGGAGIFVADKDGDTTPDYLDLDTDSDGQPDIVEGNDFNLNNISDDDVALTYLDTDGDGLDNKFDSLNSVTNIKGTSYRMGTGGSLLGDPSPGTRAPVQKKTVAQPERDWRYVTYVLPVQLLQFTGVQNNNTVTLSWDIISSQLLDKFIIERSTDNTQFEKISFLPATVPLNEFNNFTIKDEIGNINSPVLFYRLRVIAQNAQEKLSEVVMIRKDGAKMQMNIFPNPAKNNITLSFYADKETMATFTILDMVGKQVMLQKQKIGKGNNSILISGLSIYNDGIYNVQVKIDYEVITRKLIIRN